MAKYVLAQSAKQNLEDIHAYSINQFGKRQAAKYLRNLRNRMRQLANNPLLGIERLDIRPGYHCYFEGSHTIYFFVIDINTIGIVDVLHQAMDPQRHLS